jgi:hypothetical protein
MRSYSTRRPHSARGRGIPKRSDHHRSRFADRQAPGFAAAGGILRCLQGLLNDNNAGLSDRFTACVRAFATIQKSDRTLMRFIISRMPKLPP